MGRKIMKNISFARKALIAAMLFALFLPLSNMIGLTENHDLIKAIPGSSPNFTDASRIMQNKCIDCHSPGMTRFPIYSNLPVARQLMESDINNASSRFLVDKELYSGEASFTPLMLARLEGAIRNNSMPPNLYLSMHWNGRLSEAENSTLLAWIAEEREKLAWSQDAAPTLKGEPVHPLPLNVSLNQRKVALGKSLFFDQRLSGDNTMSCASCHSLTKGGTDQQKVATGIRGQKGPINSPSVYNASYNLAQFWDGRAKDLAEQAAGPVANPGEMGAEWNHVVDTLRKDERYKTLFSELYPDEGISKLTITQAIATFEESLVTGGARFDQHLRGKKDALSPAEKNGYYLFKINCASCHFGPTLGGMSYEKMGRQEDYFKLRGGSITEVDNGRYNVTKNESDRHFFKVPNLRNVELTYPYFHDGSASTLQEAVKTMALVQAGKDLKEAEVEDIVAFLKTLTGKYLNIPLTMLKESDVR
jgi:cytochrome c peroxidase